jgi:hypothetical protein
LLCSALHPKFHHRKVSDTSFRKFTDGLKNTFKPENQTKSLQFIKPHRNKTKNKRTRYKKKEEEETNKRFGFS